MEFSKKLGKVVGLYMLIIGIAILWHMDEFKQVVQSIMQDKPLMLVTGFVTLILGLIMVVSHNIWQWNWRLINTLAGWIVLLKGVGLILYPHLMDQLTVAFLKNSTIGYSAAVVDILLGSVLCYYSFKR